MFSSFSETKKYQNTIFDFKIYQVSDQVEKAVNNENIALTIGGDHRFG